MRLWIIGNGFDLHHELKTKYLHYKAHLCEDTNRFANDRCQIAPHKVCGRCCQCELSKHKKCQVRKFNELPREKEMLSEELWCNLEEGCAIDFKKLMKRGKGTYVRTLGTQSNAPLVNNFDYILNFAESFTGDSYYRWLRKVEDGLHRAKEEFRGVYLNIDPVKDLFITFNYTSMLQVFYEVSDNHIFYIHGSIKDASKKHKELHDNGNTVKGKELHAILAFGSPDVTVKALDEAIVWYRENVEHISDEDIEILRQYGKNKIKLLNKDVSRRSEMLMGFLKDKSEELKSVDEIVVAGHSLARIDEPYFYELSKDLGRKKWRFLCYNERDKERALDFCKKFWIDGSCVSWESMAKTRPESSDNI